MSMPTEGDHLKTMDKLSGKRTEGVQRPHGLCPPSRPEHFYGYTAKRL